MKIKNGFAKRNIAGSEIVVPVGVEASRFNGMITLNESGGFFWDCFKNDVTVDDVVNMVLDEYDADEATVRRDVESFVQMLRDNDLLEK